MKRCIINILRWIGAIVLPVPAMLVIPPIVAFGLSLSGCVEPNTFAGQYIRALINGIVLPVIPWYLAPSYKTIACISISALYFIAGVILTVLMYSDPNSGTLGQIFVLIGMVISMSIIGYCGYQDYKCRPKNNERIG